VPDWDASSTRLTENLTGALRHARDHAARRDAPTAELARQWHRLTMAGLAAPDAGLVGRFRGEPGLESVGVEVGGQDGAPPDEVAEDLERFTARLGRALDALDRAIPPGAPPLNEDQLGAVLEVCGWAHAEWVRIHPFANGNGRTARLWVNCIAMRYRLPPFLRLRPRPGPDYGEAGARAMAGDWRPTVRLIRTLYLEQVRIAR
jgi:hypothetical protein